MWIHKILNLTMPKKCGSTKFCSPICHPFVNQQKQELTIPSFLKIKMIIVNTKYCTTFDWSWCFRHFLAAGIAMLHANDNSVEKGSNWILISSRWNTNVFFFHHIFFVYPSLSFTKLRLNHHVNLVKHPDPMAGLLTLHQSKWNCTWNTGCLFMVTRMNAYVFAIALNSVGLFSAKPEKKHLWANQPLLPPDPERWRLKAKKHTLIANRSLGE